MSVPISTTVAFGLERVAGPVSPGPEGHAGGNVLGFEKRPQIRLSKRNVIGTRNPHNIPIASEYFSQIP